MEAAARKSDLERTELQKEKTGGFTGGWVDLVTGRLTGTAAPKSTLWLPAHLTEAVTCTCLTAGADALP